MARLTLDWIQLAAVAGALQGLVLILVLAAQRANRTANRLLAALVASFTIYLAAGPYYASGLIRLYPHFFGISYLMPWVFGPLVYLYARAASDRSWRFRRGQLVHFLPVATITLLVLPAFLLSGDEKVALWERWSARGPLGIVSILDPFKYLSGITYTAITTAYVVRNRRAVERSYSSMARVNLRWLAWLCGGSGAIWVMVTILKAGHVSGTIRDADVALAMSILVYTIGYMGLRQPEIFRYDTAEEHPVAASKLPQARDAVAAAAAPATKHGHSGPGSEEAAELREALLRIMERDQPWRESELTLAELATRLNSTPHKLSAVLNSQVGQTFYDFVNGYRVREIQRRIVAGDARSLKMLALAMDAGFASKSTFNEVFKKHTRQTPSKYREEVGG